MKYKSFNVVQDVISFVNSIYSNGKRSENYDVVVRDFFNYWVNRLSDKDERKSHFQKALNRANKAVQYEKDGKHIEASEEWRKIFNPNLFPHSDKNEERENEVNSFSTAPRPWSH